LSELFRALDIGCAPNAPRPPRGEPYLVADFVNAFPNSVDPTETKRFIHRFWPRDARFAGIPFVKPNPKLSFRRVIFLEPVSKI
jgi:hypothetical protein